MILIIFDIKSMKYGTLSDFTGKRYNLLHVILFSNSYSFLENWEANEQLFVLLDGDKVGSQEGKERINRRG